MSNQKPASQPGANAFLDYLIANLHLKNDAALARALEVAPPVVSKVRHNRLPVGASFIIRAHELTDMPIRAIKSMLAGDLVAA